MENLKQRQLDILNLIIEMYTKDAQPVGSKILATLVQASPATVRNDMSLLENLGYLEKAHTSSGRIPTKTGLRFYIDHLVQPTGTLIVQQQTTKFIPEAIRQLDGFLKKFVDTISEFSNFTIFATAPDISRQLLTGVQMVEINNRQQILLLIKDKGQVESKVVTGYDLREIKQLTRLIEDHLVGENLSMVQSLLKTKIPQLAHQYLQTPQETLRLLEEVFPVSMFDSIYVGGSLNILEYSKLDDALDMKNLYRLLSQEELMYNFFLKNTKQDMPIAIRIGEELDHPLFTNMSLISVEYPVDNHGKGKLALLGPSNLDYQKNIQMLTSAALELSESLSDYYRYMDSFQ
ncbi:MAG: heat-inducible transcriptional repressor HrcA [Streptococcaceae bacterium]|nr:heat-inducible transcriptional repressor HrcA [Streptococcaceae bacterium]